MTTKTGSVSASEEVTSIVSGLLSKANTPVKTTPPATSLTKKNPAFLYTQGMLTTELRTNIDKNWEACWPINSLRPLVLLDLISYLLFIKKIGEKKLMPARLFETFKDTLSIIKENNELSWDRFKDMDPQGMHGLFTKEMGIPDLMKNYGNAKLMYSIFVKEPLLLAPTARLLSNMVDIIKIMEAENEVVRASVFEYLLNKAEIVAQNGQVYAPDYIVKLMVALMQPTSEDVIGDPSAGNGSFLVNSAMYIANKNAAAFSNFKNDAVANIYKGIECDLIQLRIGAMNMILHGIEDPKLEGLNLFSTANLSLREQQTLILSNLFFESTEDKMTGRPATMPAENTRPETRFLNLILKNLQRGGRGAVIIRETILYDNGTEIKAIRQQIIDDHKLEAVIFLPAKTGSLFSGAGILIFAKPESVTTDKVWFYKMEPANKANKEINIKEASTFIDEHNDVADILNRWKNEKEETGRNRTGKSFYVSVDEIKANDYNLSYHEYRKITTELTPDAISETSGMDEEMDPVVAIQLQAKPAPVKIKLASQAAPVIKKFPVILVSLVVTCLIALSLYFIFSKNKNNSNNNNTPPLTAKNIVPAPKIKREQPTQKPVKNTEATGMLSREQIKAILKDTTGIIDFKNQPGDLPASTKEPKKELPKFNNVAILVNKKNDKISETATSEPAASASDLKVQYTVTDTTFFHDQPDESSHRKSYLDPLNKNILTPIRDENGFIFIVYTNRFGRTSKGWISKKDLRPIR